MNDLQSTATGWRSGQHDAWGLRAQIKARQAARDRFWANVQMFGAGAFGATTLLCGSLFVWVVTR